MDLPADAPVRWPVAPYVPAGVEGWARYKLASAQWYIDTLESLGPRFNFGRLRGVEMALDGALTALCGAVDAVQGYLFGEVWNRDGRPPKARGAQPRLADFKPPLQKRPGPVGAAGRALVSAGMRNASTGSPVGWLAELRDLRNRAVHQDTLARHTDVVIGGDEPGTTTGLAVPGRTGRVEPVAYLRGAYEDVHKLVELLLKALLTPGALPDDRQSATIQAPAIGA